jgi:predicted lysophospholipase L1 biosynthesis ABC-type transport system permease subunit
VTVIEVDAIMAQLRETLGRVSVAIEVVLAGARGGPPGAGCRRAGERLDLRLRESALLRALGAGAGA